MKVILSIDPIRYPLTGIGRYTLELARQLQDRQEIDDLRYFAGVTFKSNLPSSNDIGVPGLASRIRSVKALIARNDLALRAYQRLSHERRAMALRGHDDHVFHGTNFYLPKFDGPAVVTIHDLSVLKFPQFHPPERVRHMEREVGKALRRAAVLLTVSHAVKQEICSYFDWAPERVQVSQLATNAQFRPMGSVEVRSVLNKYSVDYGRYSLFVGTIEPRKNIERLLIAYEDLPPTLRQASPLLLVGHAGWQNEAIMQRIRRATEQGWAKYYGFVEEADLPALIAGAGLFVFPSLYEGFGLPVLEALACGVPVITSNRSSLPEVAGEAALLCNPEDVDSIRSALDRGLTDTGWRSGSSLQGPKQASKFSWERCAVATIDAYRLAQET